MLSGEGDAVVKLVPVLLAEGEVDGAVVWRAVVCNIEFRKNDS